MLGFPQHCSVALLGGGISHLPLIPLLLQRGHTVTLYDRQPKKEFDELLQHYPDLRSCFGDHCLSQLKEEVLLRTPSLRPDRIPLPTGALLTSESEQFLLHPPCPVIGVTGSDGKTTTTTLIHAILQASGHSAFLGGNIGIPLLASYKEAAQCDYAVAELSSFQLMDCHASPSVAVITNLSENHLDYHTDMKEYLSAKANIFCNSPCQTLILNKDDPYTPAFLQRVPKEVTVRYFGFGSDPALFVRAHDGLLWRSGEPLLPLSEIRLAGRHNVANYLAAIAACGDLATAQGIRCVAHRFAGVAHRLQHVRTLRGIRFYDSSIDSTPSRTCATLAAMPQDAGRLIVLLGGYDKQLSFAPLTEPLRAMAKAVILTGATAQRIASVLPDSLVYRHCPHFDDAVRAAYALAQEGDAVLLSPACASFDAFPNFEARGKRFCEIVSAFT